MRWWEHRCQYPASGFAVGQCDGILFRIDDRGDLEMKCHRCHRIQVVSWNVLESYRVAEMATT